MNWFRWFWIAWAVSGIVIELVALISRQPGATLSEQVWAIRGSGFFSLIIFFLLWMAYHFIWEGR